jgi:uncharacterized protein
MADIVMMKTTGRGAPQAEAGTPDPAKLIKGSYRTRSWNHFTGEDGRLYSGIWECAPGKVHVAYDEWEFCHIISGRAVLTGENKKRWTVKRGDAFIIPAGFKGTWETVAKLRKHYVILLPKGHS